MQGGFTATLKGRWPDAEGPLYRFTLSDDPFELMERHGHVPLPPYIEHGDTAQDVERYQTVFARNPGAVAAPTAALHFDDALLARIDARGVSRAAVTLHVGAGTFQPVRSENLAEHAHAQRVVRSACRHAASHRRGQGPRRAGRCRGHHHRAHTRILGRDRPGQRRNTHLHHARLSSSGWSTGC